MTNGLTTVAGIPGGAGVASKPPVERGEAKKPEVVPEPAQQNWWELFEIQNAQFDAMFASYDKKFLPWGWDAAKNIAEQTFRKEQQEACLDWRDHQRRDEMSDSISQIMAKAYQSLAESLVWLQTPRLPLTRRREMVNRIRRKLGMEELPGDVDWAEHDRRWPMPKPENRGNYTINVRKPARYVVSKQEKS